MTNFATKAIVATALALFCIGCIPTDSLHDMMIPKQVSTQTETISFDETGTHQSRKSLVGSNALLLFETGGEYTGDAVACNAIKLVYSYWNCVDKKSGFGTHTLEYEEYTLDVEVVYDYKIRHHGSVDLEITTTRQGNSAPVVDIEVKSSSDSYEVEVKASVDFTIKRTYVGQYGQSNYLRNSFTYSVPFPSTVDIDGDGSYKYVGGYKFYTWDKHADLSSLSSIETGQLGSKEDLSDSINLASIDLLDLAGKYSSSTTLKAFKYFVYVNFDVDLDIDFYLQSAVMPFLGTNGATNLAQSYSSAYNRLTYPCKLALTDQITSPPSLTSDCTRYLSQDATSAHLQLGLWHQYESKESYSAHIRVGPKSNLAAQTIWNFFTNKNYFQYTLASGYYMTSSTSQDTDLSSSTIQFDVPSPSSVIENNEPVAALAVSPTTTTTDGVVYASTGGSYDQDGDSFTTQISWGDGEQTSATTSGGTSSHTYDSPGVYTVVLEVVDVNGASSTTSQTVVVTQATSDFSTYLTANKTTITAGESIRFNWGSSGSSGAVNTSLNLGDNSYYNGSSTTTTHQYQNSGQYRVELVSSDAEETKVKYIQIVVEPDYSSTGLNSSNFEITGDDVLVIIDDNDAELYPMNGTFGASYQASNSSRTVLFEALNTMSMISGIDWDTYYVQNNTGVTYQYNNETGPGLNFLKDYKTIIWTTGGHYYPLTDDDFTNLEIYSGAGGTVILFSQDMLYGDCSSCSSYNSSHILNKTFGLSEADQDAGLGSTIYNSNGGGTINVGYLPLAGLQEIKIREVSDEENLSFPVDYADNISTWDSNNYALGSSSQPLMNSSNGNHGILNMANGKKTAFFAFDPVQFEYRYDLEMMMLGLSEWGEHSWNERFKLENATYLPAGVDGATIIGPLYNSGATTRSDELTQYMSMYVIQGHDYKFKVGAGLQSSGDTVLYNWNTGSSSWDTYNFSSYFSFCSQGPIDSVQLETASGSVISTTKSCNSVTGEWTLDWTADNNEEVFVKIQSDDMITGSNWYYWTKVSFEELSDSTSFTPISLNTPVKDVLHPSSGSVNSENYDSSNYYMWVDAGKTYAVTINRAEDLGTQFFLSFKSYSRDDVDIYSSYYSEYMWEGSQQGSLVFTALNSTYVDFSASTSNYTNPHITDGEVTIVAWEVDTNQPIDDYYNATDIQSTGSTGYVDYQLDFFDWWVMPVVHTEEYEVTVEFDNPGLFGVDIYYHPYNDPTNYTEVASDYSYNELTLQLDNVGFGELKIVVYAANDWSNYAGTRGNYSIEVTQLEVESMVNEILFGAVGYDSNYDQVEVDLVKNTDYVIRLNATPSELVGSKQGDNLEVFIHSPSGLNTSSIAYGDTNNRTIVYSATETGTHTLVVSGSDGSYWLWPFEDLGPSFTSYPQRYATAEIQFDDVVEAEQKIASDTYGFTLSTWQTFHLEQGPSGLTLDSVSGDISYLPSRNDVGSHSVSIRLDNEWGMSTWQNFTLVVAQLPNTAPVITSTGTGSATVGSQYSTYIQASDIDNESITFSLVTSPSGSSIDSASGQLTWTPQNVGTQQFTVMATDARGLSTSISFNLSSQNSAPLFTPISNGTTGVGSTHSIQASALDSDGHNVLYGLRYGPSGMTITPQGAVSWTPVANQIGDHTVVLEVNDAYGGNDVLIYTITVPNSPAVMSLSGVPSTMYPGDELVLNPVISDNDGHEAWLMLDEGPRGTTVTSNGTIVWKPTADQIGTHQFTVFVIDAWGEGTEETWNIEVLNRNPSAVFNTPIQDSRLREVFVIYTPSDQDGHSLSTSCTGTDIVSNEINSGQFLITWTVPEGEVANDVSCTSNDDYGGTITEEIQLTFTELDLSDILTGDTTKELGEQASATWYLPFDSEEIQTTIISGNGELQITGSDDQWEMTYTPNEDTGLVIISLEAESEYSDLVNAIWTIDYSSNPLTIDITEGGVETFGETITREVTSSSTLSGIELEVLKGSGTALASNDQGTWTISYTPEGDEGIQVIVVKATDVFARTTIYHWAFEYAPEDLSWSCEVSELTATVERTAELSYTCSRSDVNLEIVESDESIVVSNDEGLISYSNLPYGLHTTYLQFTGPDSRVELVEREVFTLAPVSEGTLTTDTTLFSESYLGNYMISLQEKTQISGEFIVTTSNTVSHECSFTASQANEEKSTTLVSLNDGCSFTIYAGEASDVPFIGIVSLINETGVVLDSLTIEIESTPEPVEDAGLLASISPVSTSMGLVLGIILTAAVGIMMRRKSSELELQEVGVKSQLPDIPSSSMSASISSPVQESSFEQASEESPDMNTPTADMPATSQDGEGYEWLQTPDGANWYRLQDSGSEWTKY